MEDRVNATRELPPALVLGGSHNALSIARSLGRRGVRVYALNRGHAEVRWSRYARWLPLANGQPFEAALEEFLCGRAGEAWRGAVLLAAGDEALKLFSDRHAELSERFRVDLCNPTAQRRMLDKLATYEAAHEAGVPAPRFWVVGSRQDLEARRDALVYPLIVKPRESHLFQSRFRAKFLVATSWEDLVRAMDVVEAAGIDCILVEKIPGPDTLLCSYYTYLDADGSARFDFTKRILRRSPPNMGLATYHITDHVPDLKEPALRLFRHVGLRGVANVEFKRDPRDGVLKLMECNARFTAANCLLASCGLDLTWFVYSRLAGLPEPVLGEYPDGVRLWDPLRDLKSLRALRRTGELDAAGWLRSVMHRQTFPVFAWNDPLPTLRRLARRNPTVRRSVAELRSPAAMTSRAVASEK
jgi:predicted ATP-grasp superfamily ATP-dependent carboligase